EIRSRLVVAREDQEAASPVDVERVRHRMIGVHFVDQPKLHLVPDMKRPVDLGVLGACLSVDELPAHVRRRRHPIDLDHVVLPLDALRGVVRVIAMVIVMSVVLMLAMFGLAFVTLSVVTGPVVPVVLVHVLLTVVTVSMLFGVVTMPMMVLVPMSGASRNHALW